MIRWTKKQDRNKYERKVEQDKGTEEGKTG